MACATLPANAQGGLTVAETGGQFDKNNAADAAFCLQRCCFQLFTYLQLKQFSAMTELSKAKQALAKAAQSGQILSFVDEHPTVDLVVLLTTFDSTAASKLFANLAERTKTIVPLAFGQDVDDETAVVVGGTPEQRMAACYAELRSICGLLYAFCSNESRTLPKSFIDAAEQLHNTMYTFVDERIDKTAECRLAMKSVVTLCEKMYLSRPLQSKTVLPLPVMSLMVEATNPSNTNEMPLKRLWTLREALSQFDYDDEESESLRECIMRAFALPMFLQKPNGRNLLACFMTLSPAMTLRCHEASKAQFPITKEAQEWYGMVYVKAWQDAEGATRTHVEESCVQDLLYRMIHAASPSTRDAIRVILSHFLRARDKKRNGIDAMLLSAADALVWRGLDAGSSVVRHNAAIFFRDSFPIGLSEVPAAERDNLVNKQIKAVVTLAADDVPSVREFGISFLGHVLEKFWDTFPAGVRIQMLQKIADGFEDDKSPAARAAALKAMQLLVNECPASHSVLNGNPVWLKGALNLLSDKSENVRKGAAKLLHVLSTNSGGPLGAPLDKFIDSDVVMARLVLDKETPTVINHLIPVLSRSYFPTADQLKGTSDENSKPVTAACKRIMLGLKTYEEATITLLNYIPMFPTQVSRTMLADVVDKLKATIRKVAVDSIESAANPAPAAKESVSAAAAGSRGKRDRAGQGKASASADGASSSSSPAPTVSYKKMEDCAAILRAIGTLLNGMAEAMGPICSTPSNAPSAASTSGSGSRSGYGSGYGAGAGGNDDEDDVDPETGKKLSSSSSSGSAAASKGGAMVNEDTAVRRKIIASFTGADGKEISFLMDAFGSAVVGPSPASRDGDHGSSQEKEAESISLFKRTITASLLSIAQHIPAASLTDLPAGLWSTLVKMTDADLTSEHATRAYASGSGGASLPTIISCLCSWGKGPQVIEVAAAALQGIVKAVSDVCEADPASADTKMSVPAFIASAGVEMHPIVAAAALEHAFAYALSVPVPKAPEGANPVSMIASTAATTLSTASLLHNEYISLSMAALAESMVSLGGVIAGGPSICSGPAGALVATLAPVCARVWCRITGLQLLARETYFPGGAMGSEMVEVATTNIGDISAWLTGQLMPVVLAADTICQGDVSAPGVASADAALRIFRPVLQASYSVIDSVCRIASELTAAGLAAKASVGLLVGLTSDLNQQLPAVPPMGIQEGEDGSTGVYASASTMQWCTCNMEQRLKIGGSDAAPAVPRLHSRLLGLGERLLAVAAGNVVVTVQKQQAGVLEPVQEVILLERGDKTAVHRTVAQLLCAGTLNPVTWKQAGSDNAAGDGPSSLVASGAYQDFAAAVAEKVMAGVVGEAKKIATRSAGIPGVAMGERAAMTMLGNFLLQVLPVLESLVSSPALAPAGGIAPAVKLLDAGQVITSNFQLACPQATAVLTACTGSTSGQHTKGPAFATRAPNWAGMVLAETLSQRLKIVSRGGAAAMEQAGPRAGSPSIDVTAVLALISAAAGACTGPHVTKEVKQTLSEAVSSCGPAAESTEQQGGNWHVIADSVAGRSVLASLAPDAADKPAVTGE